MAVYARALPATADIDRAPASRSAGIKQSVSHYTNRCTQNRNRPAGLADALPAYIKCAAGRDKAGIPAVEDDRAALVMHGTGINQSGRIDDIADDIARRTRGQEHRSTLGRQRTAIGY